MSDPRSHPLPALNGYAISVFSIRRSAWACLLMIVTADASALVHQFERLLRVDRKINKNN